MYDLLWQVYGVEKKYFDHNQISPKDLKDEYDIKSIKIGAFQGDNILGTLRMILSPKEEPFYVEKDFNIDLSFFPRKISSELSRFAVLKNYRNELISFGLLKKTLEISKKMDIKYWIVVIPDRIKQYFSKSFGVKICPIKEKKLTKKQVEVRKKMLNYYKTCDPHPYFISLKDI